tara:strand:+ start:167 stop:280 length:114 start_codon:yes stop_codon:yes gene_type:complete
VVAVAVAEQQLLVNQVSLHTQEEMAVLEQQQKLQQVQ